MEYTIYKDDALSKNSNSNHRKHLLCSPKHCINQCKFYKTCFSNTDFCMIHVFDEVLSTLTAREEQLLKLKYGYYGELFSMKKLSKEFNVCVSRIGQITAKALRKLRHPSRLSKIKNYAYSAFLLGDNFYSNLLSDLMDEESIHTLHSEVELNIDFSIVDKEKSSLKTAEIIKDELTTNIENLSFLDKYKATIIDLNIYTLEHLLYTPTNKIISTYYDESDFYEMKHVLEESGYKFKYDITSDFLGNELYSSIDNKNLFDAKFDGLPIGLMLKLFESGIFTYRDLVTEMPFNESIGYAFSNDDILTINQLLLENKLCYKNENGNNLYLTQTYIAEFCCSLIDWMIKNGYSVNKLISSLRNKSLNLANALLYIKKMYPDFAFPGSHSLDDYKNLPIKELNLSTRSYNCLKSVGITTVADLASKTNDEIIKIRNLGKKSAKEVIEKISMIKNGLF